MAKDNKVVPVRLLQKCGYGAADAVVELPAEEAAVAKADGLCDDDEHAVEYARALNQQ